MPKLELAFSITMGRLWAGSNATPLQFTEVWSGGRGGSTVAGAVDRGVANRLWAIGQKTDHAKGIHGGPLPLGEYTVDAPARHPHLGLSAKLTPTGKGLTLGMFGRGGFYIHGRGPHGSDGCIVPERSSDFRTLMKLLEESAGGTLNVWP